MRGALLVLALAGCDAVDRWLEPEPVPAPIPALTSDGVVHTAVITEARVPPPPLWRGELPARPYELGRELWPVVDGMCFDAPDARDALLEVLADAPVWAEPLQGCAAVDFCRWAVAEAEGRPDLRDPLLLAAATCPDPGLIAVYGEPSAPDEAVAAWFAEQARLGRPTAAPRLDEAARRLVSAGESGAALDAVAAIAALPDREPRLIALAEEADTPWIRREIGLALEGARTPEGRRLHEAACAELEGEGRCGPHDPVYADPLVDLEAAVRHPRIDPLVLVRHHPEHRRAIVAALRGCAVDGWGGAVEADRGRRCLVALVETDRAAARALADSLQVEATPYAWWTLVRSLQRYDGPEALLDDLRARGLLDGTELSGETALPGMPATPVDALVLAGRGVRLDVHGKDVQGWVIRRLLGVAGATEVPAVVQPPLWLESAPASRQPRRTMLAWTGGRRLRALARDYGAYADVEQAIGFVNAVLAARGAERRLALAEGELGGWVAVAGAPDALQALSDDGLLLSWNPATLYEGASDGYDGDGYQGDGYEGGGDTDGFRATFE